MVFRRGQKVEIYRRSSDESWQAYMDEYVGLHGRIIGRPGRAPALERFLRHVGSRDDVWVTTRAEIARHWRAEHGRR